MIREPVQFRFRVFRRANADQFDLVELMHANESTRADTGGAGFSPKTGTIRDVSDRQSRVRKDFFAMKVCQRHLGSRGEVKCIPIDPVELLFELWKL